MKKFLATLAGVAALVAATPALANNANITVINDSSSDISEIHMSDIDMNDWGRDLLGRETLFVGYQLPEMSPFAAHRDLCRYDLKVTFDDGREMMINDFNACETLTLRVRDRSFVIEDLKDHVSTRRAIAPTSFQS
ncbi:hypothetical protein [Sphingomonas sp. Leaf37]|uniref:hypothetical protein n=1 Tax=Sphingomonas sp. Leaf37 TaxID=2876552 RepID=UPI001E3DA744|nr:hypothetical protein [Sphingomonas sp. Leaf37]